MLNRIIMAVIFGAMGAFCVWKPMIAVEFVGRMPGIERFFTGGSYSAIKFIGVILIFLSFAVLTGVHANIINWLLDFIYR